jgi:hypothetical protein
MTASFIEKKKISVRFRNDSSDFDSNVYFFLYFKIELKLSKGAKQFICLSPGSK